LVQKLPALWVPFAQVREFVPPVQREWDFESQVLALELAFEEHRVVRS
jgi:hypothetical protein